MRGMDSRRLSPDGKFGIACEVYLTGGPNTLSDPTTDDFTTASLDIGSFYKGPAWEVYKTAAVRKGANPAHFVENGNLVNVTNTAVAPFLSLFDVVFLNHWAPPRVLKRIKDLAQRGDNTALGMRGCHIVQQNVLKDDVSPGLHYSPLGDATWNGIKPYYMQGTGPNADGSLWVDPDEGSAWAGYSGPPWPDHFAGRYVTRPAESCGHSPFVDYRLTDSGRSYAQKVADLHLGQWASYWNHHDVNGASIDAYIHHDILKHFPSRGAATNAPTIADDVWQPKSDAVPLEFRNRTTDPYMRELWAGNGTTLHWDDLQHCHRYFYGFAMSEVGLTMNTLKSRMTSMLAKRFDLVAFGNQNALAAWHTIQDTWSAPEIWDLHAHAITTGFPERWYWTMVADNVAGRLFWHPTMRPVS